jgi:hypothetical protein
MQILKTRNNITFLAQMAQLVMLTATIFASCVTVTPQNNQTIITTSTKQETVKCDLEVVQLKSIDLLFTSDTLLDESEARRVLERRFATLITSMGTRDVTSKKRIFFSECLGASLVVQAAIEVDSIPASLPAEIRQRTLETGKFIVAHFEGNYDRIVFAANQIRDYSIRTQLVLIGSSFEVFPADPYKARDSRVMLIDVYQRVR